MTITSRMAARPFGCAAAFLIFFCLMACLPVRHAFAQETAEPEQPAERVLAGKVEQIEGQAVALYLEDPHAAGEAEGGERELAEGAAIFVHDVVRTSPEGKVKIRFEDDSVMDVGMDSEVRITSMVYDPENAEKSSQVLSMLKGLFRFVTGAITRQDPKNTTLQAPLATVGIRGTITDHFVDVSEETVDGTPVRVVNSELHALRESAHEVVVKYQDREVLLAEPDSVADVQLDMPVAVRPMTGFEKRHFGEVAIEPYPFDPEVGKTLKQGWATPKP